MSFSSDIKEQLCSARHKCPNCAAAELSGVFEFSGRYDDGGARFTTENDAVAGRIVKMIYDNFGDLTQYRESGRANKFFLDNKKVIDTISRWEEKASSCCYNSYIRGAFLGSGSVTDPKKGYHLEFDTRYELQAQKLLQMLEHDNISAKITSRKDSYIVYIKECEKIAEVLGHMGASGGAFELFSVQIERGMRNDINRRINFETANTDKTIKAATRQNEAIRKIKAAGKWGTLPKPLQDIGELREQYPNAGLKELGQMSEPKVGKSGVNHRLNKIIQIAKEL